MCATASSSTRRAWELSKERNAEYGNQKIWIPPSEKHWHGATATTAMTHIAIQEQLVGKTADWMEKVSDEQYHA